MTCRSHILLVFLLFIGLAQTKAGIIKIVISTREPAFNGKTFGNIGAYEKLKGKAYGEVDPNLPQNALITDIQLAPRNARGMVEYSTDIYILKPLDLSKGNHKLFENIPNRGNKTFSAFNKSGGGNEPTIGDQEGAGFLMQMGYTVVWCGWDI